MLTYKQIFEFSEKYIKKHEHGGCYGLSVKTDFDKGKAVVADALGPMNKNRYEVLDKFFNDNRPNRFGF